MLPYLTGSTNDAIESRLLTHGIGLMCSPTATISAPPAIPPSRSTTVPMGPGGWKKIGTSVQTPRTASSSGFVVQLDRSHDRACGSGSRPVLCRARRRRKRRAHSGSFCSLRASARVLGYKTALVAHDGLEAMSDQVDWDAFDVLFVGGSTAWKTSPEAAELIREAKARGK